VWVLGSVYDRSHEHICKILAMLLAQNQVAVEGAEVVPDALGQYRKRPALRFTDCLILESARRSGACRWVLSIAN